MRASNLVKCLVGLVTVGMAGCAVAPHETVITATPRRVHAEDPAPSAADVAGAKAVSADEIYTRYSRGLHDNGNADQRYLNRWLVVTGVFNDVSRSMPPHLYLELRTHDPEGFVYAELSSEAGSLLATLRPGTSVRLLCQGNGMTVGSPLLRACRLA